MYVHIATEFSNLLAWARVKVQTPLLQFLVDFCRTNPQLFMGQQIHNKRIDASTRRRSCCVNQVPRNSVLCVVLVQQIGGSDDRLLL